MGIKVDKADLRRLERSIDSAINTSMDSTYLKYRSLTPIRGGNARNNTKYSKSKLSINSNYPYAGRLDNGWSKQSPKGFTEPSLKYLEQQITKQFKRI